MLPAIDGPTTRLVVLILLFALYFVASSWTQGFYEGLSPSKTVRLHVLLGLIWPVSLMAFLIYAVNVRISSRGYYASIRARDRIESWE